MKKRLALQSRSRPESISDGEQRGKFTIAAFGAFDEIEDEKAQGRAGRVCAGVKKVDQLQINPKIEENIVAEMLHPPDKYE